ncbi:MAG: hypothetical protein V5A55_06230 [Halovenus sp.]
MSGEPSGQQNQDAQDSQPQSARPRGEQRQYQEAAPGVGEILNREDTKDELKFGVALFAILAVGLGLGAFLVDILDEPLGRGFFASISWVIVPVLGAVVGLRISEQLADLPDNLAYATAAVAGIVGTVVFGIVTWLFGEIIYEVWASIGDLIELWIAFGIAAAVVAAAAIAIERTF